MEDGSNVTLNVIKMLQSVPGITQANKRDVVRAIYQFTLTDGTELKTFKNPVGVDHVFLVDKDGVMVYGGYVGWIHSKGLFSMIDNIRMKYKKD